MICTTNSSRFCTAVVLATLVATLGVAFGHAWSPDSGQASGRASYSLSPAVVAARPGKLPAVMLWAWERPEDLSSIDPHRAGVAFLARSVSPRRDGVYVSPRLQPLQLAPGTRLEAVVRVEAAANASLSPKQLEETARAIAEAAQAPGLSGLQIDFDATRSQRDFYRALIGDVRREIRPALSLSITALASWCLGDDWLRGLPIDDAVPMLFRMSAGTREIAAHIESGADFRESVCRQSLGVATDEPLANLPAGRRLYIFSPRAWTPGAAQLATQMVRP